MFRYSATRLLVCDMAGTIIQEKGIVYDALYNTIKMIQPTLQRSAINEFYGCQKSEVIKYFINKEEIDNPDIILKNLNSEFNYFLKLYPIQNKDLSITK